MRPKEKKNAVFASIVKEEGQKINVAQDQSQFRKESGRHGGGDRRRARPSSNRRRFEKPRNRQTRVAMQTSKESFPQIPPIGDNLRIIPLGGVEEVGRNMTAIEYKDDIIVVDAGLQFKEENTPGIDFIIPNIKYLMKNKDRIKGLFITHGHLDHIGAIPYIIEPIGNPTIYSRQFGALMIKRRQEEFPHLQELNIKIIEGNEKFRVGEHFKIESFPISHTIPDSMGLIIETPVGKIVFIEDVRVDNIESKPTEEEEKQYERFKKEEILLLTMDSTSIEKRGFSISESVVVKNIEKIIRDVPGRLIIGTFASQVERIISIISLAEKYGKKVAVEGRSMKTNLEIIKQLSLLSDKNLISVNEINNYEPKKVVLIATGAQGEEYAALMRIANKTHKSITLSKNDTVLLSSSIIPGNEYAITKLKDNLYRSEAKVITYLDSDIHASGHGNRGELEWIHKKINYKFFMPVHGHHYMLRQHAELSQSLGTPVENIAIPNNGSIIEIYDNGQKMKILKEEVPNSPMMVEGYSVGDMQEVVIRDRKTLAEEGMFVIIASINTRTGKLKKSPDIISRGFVYLRESQDLLQQARLIIKKTIEESAVSMNPIDFDYIKANVTENISQFLFQKTAKHPIVIPVILGV